MAFKFARTNYTRLKITSGLPDSYYISAKTEGTYDMVCFSDDVILVSAYSADKDADGLYAIKDNECLLLTTESDEIEDIVLKDGSIYYKTGGSVKKYNCKSGIKTKVMHDYVLSYAIAGDYLLYSKIENVSSQNDIYTSIYKCNLNGQEAEKILTQNWKERNSVIRVSKDELLFSCFENGRLSKYTFDGQLVSSFESKGKLCYLSNNVIVWCDNSYESKESLEYTVMMAGEKVASFTVEGGSNSVAYNDGKVYLDYESNGRIGMYIYDIERGEEYTKDLTDEGIDHHISDLLAYDNKIYILNLWTSVSDEFLYWTMDPDDMSIAEVKCRVCK